MAKEKCQVQMHRRVCGRRIVRDGKCIFHLEDKSGDEVEEFEVIFRHELKRVEEDENVKVIDFTGFIFPKAISFETRESRHEVREFTKEVFLVNIYYTISL